MVFRLVDLSSSEYLATLDISTLEDVRAVLIGRRDYLVRTRGALELSIQNSANLALQSGQVIIDTSGAQRVETDPAAILTRLLLLRADEYGIGLPLAHIRLIVRRVFRNRNLSNWFFWKQSVELRRLGIEPPARLIQQ